MSNEPVPEPTQKRRVTAARVTAVATCVIAICAVLIAAALLKPRGQTETLDEKRVRYAKVCKEYDRVSWLQSRVDEEIKAIGPKVDPHARKDIADGIYRSYQIDRDQLNRLYGERAALRKELGL